ncbi:MAG: class I SAM-dependent methyltransferase [Spartobacteria bacterium]|nr:class I SAM-dependent methyltransferase [Spartobacteria bacterium]
MESIDYNAIFCRMRARCAQQHKTPEEWDTRAEQMNAKEPTAHAYTRDLLAAINTNDCRSVFDVCCGPGHLLTALAGHMEYAYGLDFSSVMLQTAHANARRAGVENYRLFLRAWEDAWDDLPQADIVTASRCLDVDDMAVALRKLDALARRRVYISYRVGAHHLSPDIIAAVQRDIPPRPDYLLLVNILYYQMHRQPALAYITTPEKTSTYPSFASLRKRVEWSLGPLADDESRRLEAFYLRLPEDDPGARIHTHPMTWALISWEK